MSSYNYNIEIPGASIIIPTLNEEKYLPELLTSLQKISIPLDIIVVDGNSEDGTIDVVEKFKPYFSGNTSLTFIRSARGIALQRNLGATRAKYDVLIFCDADIVFPSAEHYEKIVSEFAQNQYVVAAPVMFPLESESQFRKIFKFACFLQKISIYFNRPYFAGSCILTTRYVFEKVGGFDTAILLGEDVDYSLRASALGRYALIKTPIYVSARRIIKYGYWWAIKELPNIIQFSFTGKLAHTERMFYPFGTFGDLKK